MNYDIYFVLQELIPTEVAKIKYVQDVNQDYGLRGKGVSIGIIDTGIDYLNEEFLFPNGKTKIEYIWDQNINSSNESTEIPYGTIYTSDDIDRAIEASKKGENPYDIVPSKDEIGHGTEMASIISSYGYNNEVRGVVPESSLCIIKLKQDYEYKEKNNINIPVYNVKQIMDAINNVYMYIKKTLSPLVIFLPLGSNSGNHKGKGLFDEFVTKISNNKGMIVVTGTGNEGVAGTHASGTIRKEGETSSIELLVSKEQKNIKLEIWVPAPDIMTVEVISPSGERTGEIGINLNKNTSFKYLFEKTNVNISYDIPEEYSGDELIIIEFTDIQEGTWTFNLTGKLITIGEFNAWIPVSGITKEGTRFRQSDPFGTITIPGDVVSVLTTAAYNQLNYNILDYSGRSFRADNYYPISVAAGGVNAPAVSIDNKVKKVSGTSVSSAIAAGVCAMLLEWGIINGNFPDMYAESIITFIVKGAQQRKGDIYPNPLWGYGLLDVYGIFLNMT